MKKHFLILFATACLLACQPAAVDKPPLEQSFTADNKSQLAEALNNSSEVTQDQKTELSLYLLRVSGDTSWNADPSNFKASAEKYASHFPNGKTPLQVIEEQIAFEEADAKQAGMTREQMQNTSGDGDGPTPEKVDSANKSSTSPVTSSTKSQTIASKSGPVIQPLSQLVGKTPEAVAKVLGKPVKTETVKPSGTSCPCPKHFYSHKGLTYEVVYIDKAADWITITSSKEGQELPIKPGASTLSDLGLNAQPPQEETPAGMQWRNVQGYQLIQADDWMIYVKHKTP